MAYEQSRGVSRRAVLKTTAAASAAWSGLSGAAAAPAMATPTVAAGAEPPPDRGRGTMAGVPFERFDPVRIGIIGLGNRGSAMLPVFLAVPGVRVVALCDTAAEKAQRGARTVTETGQPEPALYTKGERAYEKLCARDDIDFVYAATPWQWHAPMGVTAMEQGSRRNMIAGTKGVFEDYPPRIYLEPDMSHHQWGDFSDYAEYDHWLWKEHSNPPDGHGGMDYIMIWRLGETAMAGARGA